MGRPSVGMGPARVRNCIQLKRVAGRAERAAFQVLELARVAATATDPLRHLDHFPVIWVGPASRLLFRLNLKAVPTGPGRQTPTTRTQASHRR